jgi:hypothetical protein
MKQGRPNSSFSSNRPSRSVSKPQPKPQHVPVPIQTTAPSFGQSVKEGFGVGVGMSLAQRAVSALFGPPRVQSEVHRQDPCSQERTLMDTCFKVRGSDTYCEGEISKYKECTAKYLS